METKIINNSVPINTAEELGHQAIELLKTLIATPSFSGEEKQAADFLENFLSQYYGIRTIRKFNNIWCYNKCFDFKKPTVLLTSHMDTVIPHDNWLRDPFTASIHEGKLYGLGSNDSGASLVSLISAFLYFYEWKGLPFNLCLALTTEEQNSGKKGIRSILPDLMPISFAIVGEPTDMEMAIEEMGAIVLDCTSSGVSGHASLQECDNAIYRAMRDIAWFSSFRFPVHDSDHQAVKMTVTEISAGVRHNIVPGECSFTVDIRFDHHYNEKEIMNIIRNHTFCETVMRTNLITPSAIDLNHPLVRAGKQIGRATYFSPTSSERSLLNMPSLKMGPGSPSRSLMNDEYVHLFEVNDGTRLYVKLLESLSGIINQHSEIGYDEYNQDSEAELILWKS
ncbi:M20/M25/M40 family metallo-hydrolase [Pedobacter mendelii]|uniref:Acetylornithine deacetylase n=1 Tax=Pedobacter mendelii TaxID=1908240 RepID=A0ABQ2BIF7_9SPHI|nr:M20/M25/M40 family metallo-hydrolase [Pedobacter mendelii]GGI24969.1 acetylornithine deacetylase [Pedobacter mendelii]